MTVHGVNVIAQDVHARRTWLIFDKALGPATSVGIIVGSGAHLHSSVPNTSGYTRFSIEFRTVHLDDVREGVGAPNLDSECTGTTMRDYLSCEDLSHVSNELIAKYDTGPATDGVLVYQPPANGQ